jgi:hypothetical protein
MDKAGLIITLLGFGGLAEAYGSGKQLSLSLILVICGALLIFFGDLRNDTQNYKRSRDDSNRPYFLP